MNYIKRFWNATDEEINQWIVRNDVIVISASITCDEDENECVLIVYREVEYS